MGLDISTTRFKPFQESELKTINAEEISAIKTELLEEIACYYALKHQLKVIIFSNLCYFCCDCKQKEYYFQLSLVSRLSLAENSKLEILIQNQEVIFSNNINYLKHKLSYFRSQNIQKQKNIDKYISKSYSDKQICCGCGN